jgi:hypothetical protein
VTEEDASARIHQPPEAAVSASFLWGLEISSPNIDDIAASDFADLVCGWGSRKGTEPVTTNESQDRISRPFRLAFVFHFPGLDELGTGWEDMTIGDIVVIHKGGDESWGKRVGANRSRVDREVRNQWRRSLGHTVFCERLGRDGGSTNGN